jgi:hypothetical protein
VFCNSASSTVTFNSHITLYEVSTTIASIIVGATNLLIYIQVSDSNVSINSMTAFDLIMVVIPSLNVNSVSQHIKLLISYSFCILNSPLGQAIVDHFQTSSSILVCKQ